MSPYGIGTYGSQVGRPKKKSSSKKVGMKQAKVRKIKIKY